MSFIKSVEANSLAEELEIEVGDRLIAINGNPIYDIIDYMFLINDESVVLEIEKKDGDIWEIEVDKDFDETLGVEFDNPIIDHARSCTNNCVFCFIDQLPKGMRESLYFKDDDSRLSFLQGNFVTLTNLKDADIDRIIRYRISPINVSVHTTDPELRKVMLNNRFAGHIMERLKKLIDGGIVVNAQIVLCPGYNDKAALERTLSDLMQFHPNLNSVAIVPIGLTQFREGLIEMKGFNKESALDTIERVHRFQKLALDKLDTRFAFLADEFYILAEQSFPEDAAYESYIQLEDGIGMIRKLTTEVSEVLNSKAFANKSYPKSLIVTGTAAGPFVEALCTDIMKHVPELKVDVATIVNRFFGERITVAGLLTGKDIKEQIKLILDQNRYDQVLLPSAMFRDSEEILLDDVTLEELSQFFSLPFIKVECTGYALIDNLTGGGKNV